MGWLSGRRLVCLLRVQVSYLVQRLTTRPTLWTSSTRRLDLGALQLSQCLEVNLQPHRCRMSESRSSLVALVRVTMLIFASFRVELCGLGNGMVEWAGVGLLIACASLMPCAAGGASNAVDILNVTSGTWSTAALSVARWNIEATTLPNLGVAFFVGGDSTCSHVYSHRFVLCFARWEWDA
jgi:hypothetical protein